MRIAICDDNKETTEIIKEKLEVILKDEGEFFPDITLYTNGEDLIREAALAKFDVVFLDIEMPEVRGDEIADYFQKAFENIVLIFVSSHNHYVFDVLKYNPASFVRKTNLDSDLRDSLQVIMERLLKIRKTVLTETSKGKVSLCPSLIWYFESFGHKIEVNYAKGKKIVIHTSLRKIEKQFGPEGFLRIYKSIIVNVEYIRHLEEKGVVMDDPTIHLPVSKYRMDVVKERFFEMLERRV